MIQKLSQKGIRLEAVSKILQPSRLRVIPARLQETAAIEDALRAQGVNEPERYVTDAPIIEGGQTYVLMKMWAAGPSQRSRLYETRSARPGELPGRGLKGGDPPSARSPCSVAARSTRYSAVPDSPNSEQA